MCSGDFLVIGCLYRAPATSSRSYQDGNSCDRDLQTALEARSCFVPRGHSPLRPRQQTCVHSIRAGLDLSKFQITFSEEFDSLSVSPWGPNTRWIAHTPGPVILATPQFADPRLGVFPFTINDGILRIEAKKNAAGKWESGLLASADSNGRGFSQQYGYFEMRAKLPKGKGVWPAFWLSSVADPRRRLLSSWMWWNFTVTRLIDSSL